MDKRDDICDETGKDLPADIIPASNLRIGTNEQMFHSESRDFGGKDIPASHGRFVKPITVSGKKKLESRQSEERHAPLCINLTEVERAPDGKEITAKVAFESKGKQEHSTKLRKQKARSLSKGRDIPDRDRDNNDDKDDHQPGDWTQRPWKSRRNDRSSASSWQQSTHGRWENSRNQEATTWAAYQKQQQTDEPASSFTAKTPKSLSALSDGRTSVRAQSAPPATWPPWKEALAKYQAEADAKRTEWPPGLGWTSRPQLSVVGEKRGQWKKTTNPF